MKSPRLYEVFPCYNTSNQIYPPALNDSIHKPSTKSQPAKTMKINQPFINIDLEPNPSNLDYICSNCGTIVEPTNKAGCPTCGSMSSSSLPNSKNRPESPCSSNCPL